MTNQIEPAFSGETVPWWTRHMDGESPFDVSVTPEAEQQYIDNEYGVIIDQVAKVIEWHPEWLMENYVLDEAMYWSNDNTEAGRSTWAQAWGEQMKLTESTIAGAPDVAPLLEGYHWYTRAQIIVEALGALSGETHYNDFNNFSDY